MVLQLLPVRCSGPPFTAGWLVWVLQLLLVCCSEALQRLPICYLEPSNYCRFVFLGPPITPGWLFSALQLLRSGPFQMLPVGCSGLFNYCRLGVASWLFGALQLLPVGFLGPIITAGLLVWALQLLPVGCSEPPITADWLFGTCRLVVLALQILPVGSSGLSNYCRLVVRGPPIPGHPF